MLSANSVSRLEYRDKPGKRPDPGISRWIRSELSVAPPRARSLIVTVWGDAIAPHGGGIWLSSLIHLMAPFGVNERLVRTSVYRLVREGWLAARQDGRRSLYRLTDQGALRFAHAYQRIYAAAPYEWNGEWEIVVATSATLDSAERAALRKELWWEGFRAVSPGLLVRPARALSAAIGEIVASLGVRDVCILTGRDAGGGHLQGLSSISRECWDVDGVSAEYRAFIRRFERAQRALRTTAGAGPEQCFVVRTLLIHAFRRASLHDPQLPAQLLPSDWPGATAYALCRDVYGMTLQQSERHLRSLLGAARSNSSAAVLDFHNRFGGVVR
ncbi:MAG: phenylacetic acid degradation operon negative regulatory protein PaaX [Betaproteobacteria bacterium]|nr:MAG: phenylacetic acid degradation operon negative regulatory protein PaaX [Betaproteobacteria bacterium]